MNGTMQDKSAAAIEDEELLSQFRKMEKLCSDKKKIVKELLFSKLTYRSRNRGK
jgi:hypothetical protein